MPAPATGQITLPQYADAERFKLGGSIRYQYQDKFDLKLKLIYNHWQIIEISEEINTLSVSEPIAWNKPVFTGDGNMGFKIPTIPFRVDVAYHLETGRKAWSWSERKPEPMKNIHDVSSSATYTINPSLSAFAKVNNILFQQYDLWYGYPAQGFNVMVGVNWRF